MDTQQTELEGIDRARANEPPALVV